jgi:hypothetical protein
LDHMHQHHTPQTWCAVALQTGITDAPVCKKVTTMCAVTKVSHWRHFHTFADIHLGAMPQLSWLVIGFLPWRPGFTAGAVQVGLVVVKVALGQIFLQDLLFSPVNVIPLLLWIQSWIIRGMENGPVSSHSSTETSLPIEGNNKNIV